jgi:Zn-dependent peptidase ImmA (M78 family)/DNA-binding XRE family transcriptional regulator
MASIKANVTPELLSWARRSAGYTLEEAAKKINNISAEKLAAWEEGTDQPTVKQLYKVAEVYKRPVGTFFLSELPQDFTIPRDFRRLPGEVAGVYSPALRRQIRLAEERREAALELFEDLGEEPPVFPLAATLDDDPDELASRIREALGVHPAEQFSWRDPQRYKPFRQWRTRIEDLGVLIFQVTGVETQEMLGLSLAEPVLPVIAVNRKIRNPNGRIFTLLHEFVHLMLRQSSICDIDEEEPRPPEEQRIEVFCNRVAGAALVPAEILLGEEIVSRHPAARREWDEEDVKTLALRFSVSREVIVRRLLIAGRTTEQFYKRKREEYRQPPAAGDGEQAGGPENRAVRALSTLGTSFITLILESHHQGHLTLSQVSGLIGERVKWVPEIERRMVV